MTVAAFTALLALSDIAELLRQIDENRTGIAIIAALVAVVHIAATGVAGRRATAETSTS